MRERRKSDGGRLRWSVALGGTLAVHGLLLVWGLPLPTEALTQDALTGASLVWLEAAAVAEVGTEESFGQATFGSSAAQAEPAPEPVQAAVPRRSRVAPSKAPEAYAEAAASAPEAVDVAATESAEQALPAETADETAMIADSSASTSAGTHAASEATGASGAGPAGGRGRGLAGRAGVGNGAGSQNSTVGQPPGLLALGNPCHGYYPATAGVSHGEVRLVVMVDANGHAHAREVVAELPAAQGFASAARACAQRLRFRPARDPQGLAIPGRAVLALSFDRT